MPDVITAARTLLERVTFDTTGDAGRGGNGGLISCDTLRAADGLRVAISRQNGDSELVALIVEAIPIVVRHRQELFDSHLVGGMLMVADEADELAASHVV